MYGSPIQFKHVATPGLVLLDFYLRFLFINQAKPVFPYSQKQILADYKFNHIKTIIYIERVGWVRT